MTEYRVCHNAAPHRKDWWTVERLERGLFWRRVWKKVFKYHMTPFGIHKWAREFPSETEARAWVAEDKRPRVHTCKPA